MMQEKNTHLIWLDLEMTGLDPQTDVILEIATIVTDKHLTILAEGPVFAIYQPDECLHKMDKWNQRQHTQSGLLARVKESHITLSQAEQATLAFLKNFIDPKKSPMCGNTICQDRRFLVRLMPELEDYFHYRNMDVSSIKELLVRWYPNVPVFKKANTHLALQDIRDSIQELAYYRSAIFLPC